MLLHRTLAELDAELTVEEFMLWKDFLSVEPCGDARLDQVGAIIARTTAKSEAPLADFAVNREACWETPEQAAARQEAAVRRWARSMKAAKAKDQNGHKKDSR